MLSLGRQRPFSAADGQARAALWHVQSVLVTQSDHTSSPRMNTSLSFSISSSIAELRASLTVICVKSSLLSTW
jgi:hypothetical protein